MIKKLCYILFLGLMLSCTSTRTFVDMEKGNPLELSPPPAQELLYRVFLIGDAGGPSLDVQEPSLKLFESFLKEADERSAAIFLGDNIYLNGLPPADHPRRAFYEARIIEQMKTVNEFDGRVFFIPGNHDWDDGGKKGLEAVKRQEKFVEKYLNRGNTFYPDNGFPGPADIKLMDDDEHPKLREDIRLILLDTQWWLHKYDKSRGDTGEYKVSDAGDVLTELDDILKKQRNDFLLVAGHHPLITHGARGGYLPPSVHLKPPVFGSLYALYRRIFGYRQDLTHHTYRQMSTALKNLFMGIELEHLVYAAGHSHSLQHHIQGNVRTQRHYLVSGAGSKERYVAKGRGAAFTHQGKGFMTLQYYEDGSVWVEGWVPKGDGSTGEMIYRNQIKEPYDDPVPGDMEANQPEVDYSDSTRIISPNPEYDNKSTLFRMIAGEHNRGYWSIPATFPVFDVGTIKGGLKPVRLGGKGQTNTLHLESKDGVDYVLRSVDKEAGRIWEEELKQTVALDLAQDQFSILNPYAALVIPELADAVEVFHTNPKIYYVPHDPRLGSYADEVGGTLALFEERPNGDMSTIKSVGYTEEVLSHAEMIREIDGDIDHRVDQEAFARARLLDMLVADWDRHSDQWRWASFEPDDNKGKIYVPIPRDRDIALMNMTGPLARLAKLGSFFQYQNFRENYGLLRGLNFNSLTISRRFTNQLNREQWLAIAGFMEEALTDEVIEKAVRNYPDPVFKKYGTQTIRIMKKRRDKLKKVADAYYDMIAEVVSVLGSNKRERFEVQILDEEQLSVKVYKLSGDGDVKRKYYDRTFHSSATQELRLLGMNGDDEFLLSGEAENRVKINIVGGSGTDVFRDQTPKEGLRPNIYIYDTREGNNFETASNTVVKTSNDPLVNQYNYRTDYKWDRHFFSLYTSYNNDDGIFLGGGPEIVRYGFRKHPAARHYFRANYAPKTGAANVRYSGWWYQVAGSWDLNVESAFFLPKSYRNFFGLGNETTLEERKNNYYRARLTRYIIEPRMYIKKNDVFTFYAGIHSSITKVDGNDDNILNDPDLNIPSETFSSQWFGGVTSGIKIRDADDASNPRQGYQFQMSGKVGLGMENTSDNFAVLSSDLRLYLSARYTPQVTFANRIGFAHNFGDFPFYESNTLGGTTTLRGYLGNRFSGRTSVYNNAEVRLELFDFYRYLLGGKIGLVGFVDTGRVWTDRRHSDVWHIGYGGGIWFNIFESFMVNTSLGISGEGTLFEIKAGFLF
ncbi:MAG: hypothetical protein FH748_07570 [Balneolaceae bacterium]|nr:hypothetical protein [Balneolaceae bacterium]